MSLAPLAATAQTSNPYTSQVDRGPIVATVLDYATVPFTDGSPRLNLMLPDPTGRLFVNDQRGTLYRVPGPGSTAQEYLDVKDLGVGFFGGTGESGFQSFAFHPDFASNGKLYLGFSANKNSGTPNFVPPSGDNHDSVVLELTATNPSADTFSGTKREILRVQQPVSNHNLGLIAFNPNATPGSADFGNLYIAFGDGGGQNDPADLAQDTTTPYGSILRVNPLNNDTADGKAYDIPTDNPFVDGDGAGGDGRLDEIYAFGFRNPQRFSWDTDPGNAANREHMFISDIGGAVIEELNLGESGGNFGWDLREGSFVRNGSTVSDLPPNDADNDFVYPIAEYDHTNLVANVPTSIDSRAIVVGYVPRGSAFGDLEGKLIFSDFPTGLLFYIDADNLPAEMAGQAPIQELLLTEDGTTNTRLLNLIRDSVSTSRADTRFGFGANGEVFILNKHDGVIRQIIPEPATATLLALAATPLLLRRRRVRRS